MRKVLKGKCVKYAVAAAMVVSMLMTTACNSKIKVDYGYSPTDYVELGNYKGIVADVDVTSITNKVIDDKIAEQMNDVTTYTDVNRGAQKSDKVTFSYSGTAGGLAIDDFTGSDYSMVLGKDAFPVAGTSLADELYGMAAGQTKVITVTMPDNSKYTDYAGKRVVFELTMSYVQQPNVPMLTDSFVKENFGLESVDSYKEYVKNDVKSTIDTKVSEAKNEAILTQLLDVCKVTGYPEEFLAQQTSKENLLKRSPNSYGKFEAAVGEILSNVRANKDAALFKYTKDFDKADINASNIVVTKEEIEEAYTKVDPKLVNVIRKALKNIKEYHEKQKQYSWFDSKPDGTILGQKVTALSRVGVYVPGGKAAYPSSVLMNVIPAKVAGVEQIIMCTPPDHEGKVYPTTLVAANEAGVDVIYKAGGAQAIAAMAYGTESVPKVDKICGPGNIYVALAKKAVFGYVSIDSVAGPSEILVIADETANPRYVAADLLSQAEHDEMASAILITTSNELAQKVSDEIDGFLKELSRSEIISKSLDNYGYILLVDNIDDAVDAANEIASEHLEIVTKDPFNTMTKIKNAGAIFLGEYSSEPLGDYFAGPNHVLPTNGTAKFFSALSVDDFIKKSSIISYSRNALEEIHNDIETFATAEHLTAHANSIKVRFEK